MPFYLRKSFKMGPLRLNVSKSGLGLSAGVRGLRVGMNAKGRAYVHGGRYGLYFRENIGPGAQLRTAPERASQRRERPVAEPITLYEATGHTYAAPNVAVPDAIPLSATGAVDRSPWPAIVLGLVGAVVLVAPGRAQISNLIGLVLILLGAVTAVLSLRHNGHVRRIRRQIAAAIADDETALPSPSDPGAKAEYERAYLQLCRAIVADGVIDDAEISALERLEAGLTDRWEFTQAVRRDAYLGVYLSAVSDHVLTRDEERGLAHLQDRLRISDGELAEERHVLARLAELRETREGRLTPIEPSIAIDRRDECYYDAPARLLKDKQLHTFQRQGQRYKVRGLVLEDNGRLLITRRELLFFGVKKTSVLMPHIEDIEFDLDSNVLAIKKAGRKTPIILSTTDAPRAAAVLAALVE